eukprot:2971637-Rhodomonas_salina.1
MASLLARQGIPRRLLDFVRELRLEVGDVDALHGLGHRRRLVAPATREEHSAGHEQRPSADAARNARDQRRVAAAAARLRARLRVGGG